MGNSRQIISKIALSLFFFIIIYFFYKGITTTPEIINESDSLIYHIPMATNFSRGRFINQMNINQGLGFYPGVGELILSLFIKLSIPLNLYNLAGLIALFFSCYFLAKAFKLCSDSRVIFAVSVCLLPTIIRLIPAQTNDIWLAIFFIWPLILVSKPKKQTSYFAKLGIFIGLLIGVKYSGILYAIALFFVFRKKLLVSISFSKLMSFLIPVFVFGASWYIRNYFVTGNPFYPVHLLGFSGNPNFSAQSWSTLTTLSSFPDSLVLLQGFISEYLVWIFSPIITALFLIYAKQKENALYKMISSLTLLAVINFIIWLPQPHGAGIQLAASNWRLTYPAMIPLMLSTFILAKKYSIQDKVYLIALASSFSVLPQLQYQPKLILIWLFLVTMVLFIQTSRIPCGLCRRDEAKQ